ncbi:AraC family transcriptional regulator [Parahaliea aestuarii]|uniref:AraC family transcriptional regulator n=1 Tax=Parahaliea aestuarii TaxID=1852021 RepID=UPI00164FF1C0|nr:AraC family transcriptional regulator [Parahaliea aestuarii]
MASSTILSGMDGAARELGFDLDAAFLRHGIDPVTARTPNGFISRQCFRNCLESLAQELNCPHLALVVARHPAAVVSSALHQYIRASATLRQALGQGYVYLCNLNGTLWRLQPDGSDVKLIRTVPRGEDGKSPQMQALSVARHFRLLQDILGESWTPQSVSFTFEPARGIRQHFTRFFQAPVYYAQEYDGLRLTGDEMDRPIATHDPELLAILQQYLASRPQQTPDNLTGRVSTLIRQHLGEGDCRATTVASQLGLHSKSLQRALRRENTSFRALLQEARLDIAAHHLSTSSIELARLADMLGYSCASALSRAFKQRHGVSPRHWRSEPGQAPTEGGG